MGSGDCEYCQGSGAYIAKIGDEHQPVDDCPFCDGTGDDLYTKRRSRCKITSDAQFADYDLSVAPTVQQDVLGVDLAL